ncbi:ketopantoate reductase [Marininema mesophilum]|uniref:2-dehydropantoate 2-reductase n=1 Tax=Marininema mesophilum TaxID=1048340 RepID=A0A1H2QFT9_9BACL|nr:2-dehydropantoate 2-reductase [Marininema mesophilum]SDW06002.1 ketopantoate reductase [Marininema mesophilum]
MIGEQKEGRVALNMETAIWGAGSIGLLWGARLALAGDNPVIITRTEAQKERLLQAGLRFQNRSADIEKVNLRAQWAEEVTGSFDRIILTVKQTAVALLVPRLIEQCHQGAMLYLFQNGMGTERLLLEDIPNCRLWRGTITEGALRENDISVIHTGEGETYLGPLLENTEVDAKELDWIEGLKNKGLPVAYDPQVSLRTWRKLAINCVINPLTALFQVTNGELLRLKIFPTWVERILSEVVKTASHVGVDLDYHQLVVQVRHVCEQTGSNRSSMYEDLRQGQPTEIDFINGYIVYIGRENGVQTPWNQYLHERVRLAEKEV